MDNGQVGYPERTRAAMKAKSLEGAVVILLITVLESLLAYGGLHAHIELRECCQ